jgi:glycosyltransferase involved in cell wall biosynthesis
VVTLVPTTLSVVIAAYNANGYITRALESVASQTRVPDEVIVIDDGSTDDTADRIKAFQGQSSLNVILQQQANRGLPATRNIGVRSSRSSLVAFLDADDTIYPTFLEETVRGLDAHSDWVACFSDRDIVDTAGKVIARDLDHPGFQAINRRPVGGALWELADEELFCKMVPGNLIPMTIVLRRAQIAAAGFFDESLRYGEDRLFLLRLIKLGGVFGYVNEPLGIWQRHDNNSTSQGNALRNLSYSDLILAKLIENGEQWRLSAKELDCVHAARRATAASWLYCASSNGSRTTLPLASRLLYERRISFYCFTKGLLRYTFSGLRSGLSTDRAKAMVEAE